MPEVSSRELHPYFDSRQRVCLKTWLENNLPDPVTSLTSLTDVDISNPEDLDVLTYDSITQTWIAAPSTGGCAEVYTSEPADTYVGGQDCVNQVWAYSLGNLSTTFLTVPVDYSQTVSGHVVATLLCETDYDGNPANNPARLECTFIARRTSGGTLEDIEQSTVTGLNIGDAAGEAGVTLQVTEDNGNLAVKLFNSATTSASGQVAMSVHFQYVET